MAFGQKLALLKRLDYHVCVIQARTQLSYLSIYYLKHSFIMFSLQLQRYMYHDLAYYFCRFNFRGARLETPSEDPLQ